MLDEQSCQLPTFHLASADIPRRQRFDAMRETVRPLYVVLPANGEPNDGMSFGASHAERGTCASSIEIPSVPARANGP